MRNFKRIFQNYFASTDGAVAIEYSLIAVALSLAIIGGFPSITAAISLKLQEIVTIFSNLN